MNNCQRCRSANGHALCIHKVPIFASLDHRYLHRISSLIEHHTYKKGETIMQEGEWSDSLIIVEDGIVKAYTINPDGREQILYIFSSGDFFGEKFILHDHQATYSVEALEETKICRLSKKEFQQVLHAFPDIAINIISALGDRMERLELSLQNYGIRNVDARISNLLLDFADKYGTKKTEGMLIRLPISREGIANYLGVTRETVSRKLGQLEQDGIIRSISNKSILIVKQQQLEQMAKE